MITIRRNRNRTVTITLHILWWHWALHILDWEFWTSKICQQNVRQGASDVRKL